MRLSLWHRGAGGAKTQETGQLTSSQHGFRRRLSELADTFARLRSGGRPSWLLVLFCGAWMLILVIAFFAWLGLSDSSGWWLAAQAAGFVLLLWLLVWGLGSIIRISRGESGALGGWAIAWKVWLLLAGWALLAWSISSWLGWLISFAWIAQSELTFRLRHPVALALITTPLQTVQWLLNYVVFPAIAIGLLAKYMLHRRERLMARWRRWSFWLVAILLALVGDEFSAWLTNWRPAVTPDWREVASVALRLAAAALIFVYFFLLQVAWYASSPEAAPASAPLPGPVS